MQTLTASQNSIAWLIVLTIAVVLPGGFLLLPFLHSRFARVTAPTSSHRLSPRAADAVTRAPLRSMP